MLLQQLLLLQELLLQEELLLLLLESRLRLERLPVWGGGHKSQLIVGRGGLLLWLLKEARNRLLLLLLGLLLPVQRSHRLLGLQVRVLRRDGVRLLLRRLLLLINVVASGHLLRLHRLLLLLRRWLLRAWLRRSAPSALLWGRRYLLRLWLLALQRHNEGSGGGAQHFHAVQHARPGVARLLLVLIVVVRVFGYGRVGEYRIG